MLDATRLRGSLSAKNVAYIATLFADKLPWLLQFPFPVPTWAPHDERMHVNLSGQSQ